MRAPLDTLTDLRRSSGQARTSGLPDETIEQFLQSDPTLATAIESAARMHTRLVAEHPDWLGQDEEDLCARVQERILNFYPEDGINPYVALGASGPWIVTTHGAVLHDSGCYGMLGLGHAPSQLTEALEEGFHGRTFWPARISHSTREIYKANLASFRDRDDLDVVPPNDIDALEQAFARAEDEGFFYEALFVEPVMGEGQPGLGARRA